MRLSVHHDNEDDYDLEALGVSDGFRPSDVPAGHNRTASHHDQQPPGRRAPPPRPSSITKPNHDSFALRHDGAMGALPSTIASSSAVPLTRSSSVSTDMAFVRPESPYRGPVGPSHPYQMYPQELRLARTASIATTSTVPVQERSYTGPSGPTHPYGMYPQNTIPEPEEDDSIQPLVPVPVGFPGRNHNYQRRLGPDGEEIADIIGPDGHTEQLPPYTKYPEEAIARKTRAAPSPLLTGAGGIGLATRNPEFASREDLNTPQSRESTRSLVAESSHQINTAGLGVSEKPHLKKWQQVARRKVCGIIPIWAFALVGVATVIFAIILITVLIALKLKHPSKHSYGGYNDNDGAPESIVIMTMTTTFDATPFTTLPDGIPMLPTGTFQVPITTPSIAPASCLTDPLENSAWSCAIPPALPYRMTVQPLPNSDAISNSEISLGYGHNIKFLPYGAQPPILKDNKVLRLVTDSDYPERGPAWFFQTTYDKLVILPEAQLTPIAKRGGTQYWGNRASDFMGRKGVAAAGDKPWLCYWNGTLLEAFIYVNQSSNAADLSPASTSSSQFTEGSATTTNSAGVPTSDTQSNDYSSSRPTQDPQLLPCYPKVFKLEERRVAISERIRPYCIQNIVSDDGLSYQPYMDGNLPTTIYLDETLPLPGASMDAERAFYGSIEERGSGIIKRQSEDVCGCVWLEV